MSDTLLNHVHPLFRSHEILCGLSYYCDCSFKAQRGKATHTETHSSKWQSQDLTSALLNARLQVHHTTCDRKNMQKEKTGWEKGKFGTSFPPRAPGFWPRWCYRISYLETSKHKQFTYHQGFFFSWAKSLGNWIHLPTHHNQAMCRTALTYFKINFDVPHGLFQASLQTPFCFC